jgi:thiol-disulfide isomerase/thioredoxin
MKKQDQLKYILSFIITIGIFLTVFAVSRFANQKRIAEISDIQQKITIDLLSSETQFSLLKEASCSQDVGSMLTTEISRLSERFGFMEEQYGSNNAEVIALKKNYSLLLIKDYLLLMELSKKCNYHPTVVLYFYGAECEDCRKENYVFSAIREKYPDVRVYAFDASLELSAIDTLINIYKVPDNYPSLVIDGKTYTGYKTVEEIEQLVPEIAQKIKDEAVKKAKEEKQQANQPQTGTTNKSTTKTTN